MPNYGMTYYQDRYIERQSTGPLGRHDFRALSRLGVSIWDTDRLRRYQLAYHPGEQPATSGNHAHWSWRSILIQEINRTANKSATRGRVRPSLVRWARAWVPGATRTRSGRLARGLDIVGPLELRSYTGPAQTFTESMALATRAVEQLVDMNLDMNLDMQIYRTAAPHPDEYPDHLAEDEFE